MLVREDGVQIGDECIQWDILLWTSWSVWETGVVGALVGECVSL